MMNFYTIVGHSSFLIHHSLLTIHRSEHLKYLKIYQPFPLECGSVLPELEIAYTVHGTLNRDRSNVVWIAHALTANADPAEWWDGMVGPGKLFDPRRYFIVCANMLGSCYGATHPGSVNPHTGRPYGREWPLITVRDIVRSHQILQRELGIRRIHLGVGGSMGGQQILEWAVQDPDIFEKIALIATNAQHSPWGIAFNESQRMALRADQSLWSDQPDAGRAGLEAARAVALLSYRNYPTYNRAQQDPDERLEGFRATTYQQYQGLKLSRRFTAQAYWSLSRSMDSHHIGRGRGRSEAVLAGIRAETLVVGIQSDILFPIDEQIFLADHIPNARLELIDSPYGHDGFLIEGEQLRKKIGDFLGVQLLPENDHLIVARA